MSENPGHKPRHALSETGASVPEQAPAPEGIVGPDAAGTRDRESAAAVERTGPAPAASARVTVIPQPSSPGDDLFEDASTQALPVIPRPRDAGSARGYPSVAVLARRSEPPVRGAASPSSGSGRLRLPELPPTVRPVLPAVLGAATALILALGVVAGVNGAPDPATAPVPPAPVSDP